MGSAKKEKGNKTKRGDSASKERPSKGKKTGRASSAQKTRRGKDDKDDAKEEATGSGTTADTAEEAAPEEESGKKKRPNPASLKAITTGATAPVDFMEDDDEAEAKPAAAAPSASETPAEGVSEKPPPPAAWSCAQWLQEIKSLHDVLTEALCFSPDEGEVLQNDAALGHVRVLESRDELLERLKVGGCLDKLADAIWPKIDVLKNGPATAAELAAQWKDEGAGGLLFGGLPQFFQGLEPRIGSPDPNVLKEMARDHCGQADAQVEFCTGNYSVWTTSEVEWKFVVEPETPLKWPIEERLSSNEATRGHMRKLMSTTMLLKRMDEQNKKLAAKGEDLLQDFEVYGGRLYTGPLFVKYNGVLRGLDSPVPYLKNDMISLVCSKEISEKYQGTAKKWEPANGTLPYEKARKELNLYTTTIHVINSCIVKMGKLTVAKPVYRGMSGRLFPPSFWHKDSSGVMGGVELAFMSTTPDRSVAYQYSQDKFGIVVEIQQGMIDRGAEIAWLSQYPHEAEVLFAPLAGLEAREMRIEMHPISESHIIVVTMRVSINLTNPTIEAVVAKRRKVVNDMGRGLLMEVRSALNKKGSNETEAYLRMLGGLMQERPLSHEATWYNDDMCFQDSVIETLRLKREVMNIQTFETKKLEGDAVAQLLDATSSTKAKVTELPEIIFREFNLLKTLNLDGFAGITTLPKTMGGLSGLQTLHLRECAELREVPPQIGKLHHLQTLNMTYCKELKELPSAMGDLASLTALDLAFCRALLTLPNDIGKLTLLQNLKLQQCSGLTEIPSSIGQCKELRKLSLYGCSTLTSLPDAIGNLPELQELNLRVCSALTHLPPTLGHGLPNLTTLDLTLCKGLTALPDSIGKMQNLQTLFLGNCYNIPALPGKIVHLKALVTLNLYNCGGLTKLPDNFHLLESLQVLSLQGCEKLVELPDELAMCPSLTTLTLWGCIVLTRMPDLTPLAKLQIDGVPEQLAEWEEAQKKKRLEDARDGKNKQAGAAAAAKSSQWEVVKKDAQRGTVAGAAVAALTGGEAK